MPITNIIVLINFPQLGGDGADMDNWPTAHNDDCFIFQVAPTPKWPSSLILVGPVWKKPSTLRKELDLLLF